MCPCAHVRLVAINFRDCVIDYRMTTTTNDSPDGNDGATTAHTVCVCSFVLRVWLNRSVWLTELQPDISRTVPNATRSAKRSRVRGGAFVRASRFVRACVRNGSLPLLRKRARAVKKRARVDALFICVQSVMNRSGWEGRFVFVRQRSCGNRKNSEPSSVASNRITAIKH